MRTARPVTLSIMIFSSFKSRWATRWLTCASDSALAIGDSSWKVWSLESLPRFETYLNKSQPSINSKTKTQSFSVSKTSSSWMILAWPLSRIKASTSASWISSERLCCFDVSLTETRDPSWAIASNTRLKVPEPSCRTNRYPPRTKGTFSSDCDFSIPW